ncbi:Hsp20/alpha crystallin family protein [Catenulispora sp. NF23]|uniref:Hsp20/alpha crystallin family protein n=1 Tax=Catenulispora pinistramenti TaxID=2705254 RepID=A0ABS5KQI9_9ACTN|nr:Hsp20/alpha crystallin family protein [Catenulispora pinistramenti]MBS2531732.1 Hsp20/alpha crystallin family protein [Catenulispora pinistramenti]MBS2548299.1 Hsp20/alpha crystallin family protein [Catenulispora pinistramenti]
MSEITRRAQFPAMPDLSDLTDPLQQLFGIRPQSPYGIRIETHYETDAYVVRGEMPGLDSAKDFEVVVTDGMLTMHAERNEQQQDRQHSEFRYGAYNRSVRLPDSAKAEKVTATYDDGILTVRVPLDKPVKAASHKIKVTAAK